MVVGQVIGQHQDRSIPTFYKSYINFFLAICQSWSWLAPPAFQVTYYTRILYTEHHIVNIVHLLHRRQIAQPHWRQLETKQCFHTFGKIQRLNFKRAACYTLPNYWSVFKMMPFFVTCNDQRSDSLFVPFDWLWRLRCTRLHSDDPVAFTIRIKRLDFAIKAEQSNSQAARDEDGVSTVKCKQLWHWRLWQIIFQLPMLGSLTTKPTTHFHPYPTTPPLTTSSLIFSKKKPLRDIL